MTSKTEKEQMLEYIAENLKDSGKIDISREGDKILLDNDKVVLLVNKEYSKKSFSNIYNSLKKDRKAAVVLYNDENTFLRNGNDFIHNTRYEKSMAEFIFGELKKGNEVRDKLVYMRPEEIFLSNVKGWVQYYQPKTQNFNESIMSCQFSPVRLKYKDVKPEIRDYVPAEADAKRMFVWNLREQLEGKLKFSENYNESLAKLSSQKPKMSWCGKGYLNLR